MTQENKDLLFKDLSARLPYGVKIMFSHNGFHWDWEQTLDDIQKCDDGEYAVNGWGIHGIKPYLRPMSSMTEEEKKDLLITIVGNEGIKYFQVLSDGSIDNTDAAIQDLNKFNIHWISFDKGTVTHYLDWLNAHHFDFRGLIEKGLAIEVNESNNPYKD